MARVKRATLRKKHSSFIFILIAGALARAGESECRASQFSVGVGAYFLQPNEVAGTAGTRLPVSARPRVSLSYDRNMGLPAVERFLFVPQVAALLPQVTEEKTYVLNWSMNANLGYKVSRALLPYGGVGIDFQSVFSKGRNIDNNGNFVTPTQNSLTWLLTANAGLGLELDKRFRLNGGTMVSRLFDSSTRRFRFLLELCYAL